MDDTRTGPLERVLVAGLCLVGLAGAGWMAASLPWPPAAGPGEFPMVAAWQKLVAPFADARLHGLLPALIAADGVLAASLGLALAWRPAAQPGSRSLARALAFGSVSAAYLFQARLHLDPDLPFRALADAVACALGGAGIASLCAFLFRYPRTPTLAQLVALSRIQRHARRLDDWVVAVWMRTGRASIRRGPSLALAACAGVAGLFLPVATQDSAAGTFLFVAFATVPVVLCGIAFVWLQAKYATGSAEDRRRIGWIHLGPAAGFAATAIALFGLLAASAIVGSDAPVLFGAPLVAWCVVSWFCVVPVLVGCFLLGLAFSMFYAGSLDPRLAMRRSLLAGLSGASLTLAFVILENLASSALAARSGLSGQTSVLAAGTVAALVFAPLRSRLDAIVGRWMDRLLPEPADGEAACEATAAPRATG